MVASFTERVTALEAALSGTPAYGSVVAALRDLEVPADVSAAELSRLYAAMFDLLGIQRSQINREDRLSSFDQRQLRHVQAVAGEVVERTIYDPHFRQRESISRTRALFASRGKPPPEGLDESERCLVPVISAPWDAETAHAQLRPFLSFWEAECRRDPTAHFRLSWQVSQSGYPVYREVFRRWWRHLEGQSVIPSGFQNVIRLCRVLIAVKDADPLPTWGKCEESYLPLLAHPHAMVRGAAAAIIGRFYGYGAHRNEREATPLPTMLEVIRRLEAEMHGPAGGFIAGFSDQNFDGLHALDKCEELSAAKFDTCAWILEVVKDSAAEEPYLPTAQSFWFYVHEYFDTKPAAVAALLDMDREWLAMMCATEISGPVDGMRPVLERLAKSANEEIAGSARDHLMRHYRVGPQP